MRLKRIVYVRRGGGNRVELTQPVTNVGVAGIAKKIGWPMAHRS